MVDQADHPDHPDRKPGQAGHHGQAGQAPARIRKQMVSGTVNTTMETTVGSQLSMAGHAGDLRTALMRLAIDHRVGFGISSRRAGVTT
jgi:hypothetical protein